MAPSGFVVIEYDPEFNYSKAGMADEVDKHTIGSGATELDGSTRPRKGKVMIITEQQAEARRRAAQRALNRMNKIDNDWNDPAAQQARDNRANQAGDRAAHPHLGEQQRLHNWAGHSRQIRRQSVRTLFKLALVAGLIAATGGGAFLLIPGVLAIRPALKTLITTVSIPVNEVRAMRSATRAEKVRNRTITRYERQMEKAHQAQRKVPAKEYARAYNKGAFGKGQVFNADGTRTVAQTMDAPLEAQRAQAYVRNAAWMDTVMQGAVVTASDGTIYSGGVPLSEKGKIAEALTLGTRHENSRAFRELDKNGQLTLADGTSIRLDPSNTAGAELVTQFREEAFLSWRQEMMKARAEKEAAKQKVRTMDKATLESTVTGAEGIEQKMAAKEQKHRINEVAKDERAAYAEQASRDRAARRAEAAEARRERATARAEARASGGGRYSESTRDAAEASRGGFDNPWGDTSTAGSRPGSSPETGTPETTATPDTTAGRQPVGAGSRGRGGGGGHEL